MPTDVFGARLSTALWVDALVRRVQIAGASAFVMNKGDAERGDILVISADLQGGAWAYAPRTTMSGERVFLDLTAEQIEATEAEVSRYAQTARSRDPDLWIIEIEDREGRHFLTENVQSSL